MPSITVFFSLLLISLGAFGYFGSAAANPSVTALIPAMLGVLLLAAALAAFREGWRKHAMHAAAAIGTIGLLMAVVRGAMKIGTLFSDVPFDKKRPVIMVLAMGAICLVYVVLCVKSFTDARRRQAAARQGQTDDAV